MGTIIFAVVAIAVVSTVKGDPDCPALHNTNPVGRNEEVVEINFLHVYTVERLEVALDIQLSFSVAPQSMNNTANAAIFVEAHVKDAIKSELVSYGIRSFLDHAFIESSLCPVVSTRLASEHINLERFQVSQIHIPEFILNRINRRN